MGNKENLYDILHVARDASIDEIKKAYRELAKKYHPDVSKEKNAEAIFKMINEAHEILSDPLKRAEYDRKLFFEKNDNDSSNNYNDNKFDENNEDNSYDRTNTYYESAHTSQKQSDDTNYNYSYYSSNYYRQEKGEFLIVLYKVLTIIFGLVFAVGGFLLSVIITKGFETSNGLVFIFLFVPIILFSIVALIFSFVKECRSDSENILFYILVVVIDFIIGFILVVVLHFIGIWLG